MKLLYVVPTLRRGGAETQLISLVNKLAENGHDGSLLCFDRDLDQLDKLDQERVRFFHVKRNYSYDFSLVRRIASLIDEEKIDVVHATLQISLFFAWAATRLARRDVSLCVTLHTTLNRNLKAEVFDRLLYRWLMRCCDAVVFVCEEQRKHWIFKWTFLRTYSHVVHNGIDAEYFSRDAAAGLAAGFRAQHGIPTGAVVIAHIAGFRVEKGHAILLESFARVSRRFPAAFLVLAGDGQLRRAIADKVAAEGLKSQVRFIGNVSDVRPLLANAEVAVIASTAETFSIAMLESLSMRVPMVATDVGGTREAVIPGRTGWLVPSGDAGALAAALEEALSDPQHLAAMGQAGRQLVQQEFTTEAMADGMARLFATLVPTV